MRNITIPLLWFAGRMTHKLQLNDHKGSWKNCSNEYLLTRLKQELDELIEAMTPDGLNKIDEEAVINEAADVANFARDRRDQS